MGLTPMNSSAAQLSSSTSSIGWIDASALMQIQSLELRARAVVEGFLTGIHRSPFHGFSVEFTEYRQYVDGDDLRYVDWKLYGRSDRYYVKRFEDETNLRCHLLVDNSQSMSYGSLGYSKAEYAKTLAGTLAYFLNHQRDAVGLIRFSDRVDEYISPRYRRGHLRKVLISLDQQPAGTSTGLIPAMEEAAQHLRKRGLLVMISDFLVPVEQLESRLAYLASGGNEIVAFQVLDPAEVQFSFTEPVLLIDAETGREMFVNPDQARADYQKRMQEHQQQISDCCQRLGVQFRSLQTDQPLEKTLSDFLNLRAKIKVRRR